MYIHRLLLLVLVILYVFAPVMTNWIAGSGAQWYRAHLLWLVVIASVALTTYREMRDGR